MQKKPTGGGVTVQRAAQFLDIYLKLIALVLLVFAIRYWARLVGLEDETTGFDTLATPWQIALGMLVVLQPVAALGLWCNARWGVVVWVLVIAIECSMFGFFKNHFGEFDRLIIFHGTSFACFALVKLLIIYLKRQIIQPTV